MPSFKISAAILATALFALSSAQQQYSIDPNSVPLATRSSWCQSQIATCPLICLQSPGASGTTSANDCDATTLAFECVCGNGLTPNATVFSLTIPYFICEAFGTQCVAGCAGDTTCQSACRQDNLCGAQNPTRGNVSTVTSSAVSSTTLPAGATSGTAGVVFNGLGGAAATQTSSSSSDSQKSNAQAALDIGRSYGLVAVFTGLFAGFALVM